MYKGDSILVINLNSIDRKVTVSTAEDVVEMRISIINRLICVLQDYAKLPDIDKDEKYYINEYTRELKKHIDCIRGSIS